MLDWPAKPPVPDFLPTGCMIFSTNPLPQVSAFPTSFLSLGLTSVHYHLLPSKPLLGLDWMSLLASWSFLPWPLKHCVVTQQAKSHNKIIT